MRPLVLFLAAILWAIASLATVPLCQAGQTVVAVAANFTEPAQQIAEKFSQQTGHKVLLSFGATGNLFNQIKNGAPFSIFLAADSARPQKLVQQGFGAADRRFTYAVGTLVLWSAHDNFPIGADSLRDPNIKTIAFCNPDAAPYGAAAIETMAALKRAAGVQAKLVEGQNIAQAYQFVKTGNADIGFVALSQVIKNAHGSLWRVPSSYYSPIRQDALLLKNGEDNEAAVAFFDFLKSPEIVQLIESYGYHGDEPR